VSECAEALRPSGSPLRARGQRPARLSHTVRRTRTRTAQRTQREDAEAFVYTHTHTYTYAHKGTACTEVLLPTQTRRAPPQTHTDTRTQAETWWRTHRQGSAHVPNTPRAPKGVHSVLLRYKFTSISIRSHPHRHTEACTSAHRDTPWLGTFVCGLLGDRGAAYPQGPVPAQSACSCPP
jgi:hypothetical protein